MSFQTAALSEIASPVTRPIAVLPGVSYRTIGVKWWGEGAYERETIDGSQTAAKTLSLVYEGDLIINKIWVRHGSTAIASKSVDGCAASGEFPTFELDRTKVLPRWIHWLTKSRFFWSKCDALSHGTSGKNRIRPDLFLTIQIPFPPLSEQQRIVARIEELAAKIEEARGLRGEAVEEAEILTNAAMRRIFSLKDSQIVPLESICNGIIDNLHSNPIYSDSGVPCIRAQDIGWGKLNLVSALKTSEEEYIRRTVRGEPLMDDIVLVREGTVGKAAIVEEGQRFSLGQRVMMLRLNKQVVMPKFFLYQILSPVIYQDQILASCNGSTSSHLNIGKLRKFTFLLPILSEQRRIVDYLDHLHASLDTLKLFQSETSAELDALLPSVLDKAFKGEL